MSFLEESLIEFQKKLNYKFNSIQFLIQALTHPSFINEKKDKTFAGYERLEFLGDSILNFTVSYILFKYFPGFSEGELSKRRAMLVNEKMLAKIGDKLNIGKFIFLGKGEENSGGRNKKSIIANTVESLIGAVYLDAGLQKVSDMIDEIFTPYIKELKQSKNKTYDHKTKLQEHLQSNSKPVPEYIQVSEKGPQHEKYFTFIVKINGTPYGTGEGKSKKEAQQNAAKEALKNMSLSG